MLWRKRAGEGREGVWTDLTCAGQVNLGSASFPGDCGVEFFLAVTYRKLTLNLFTLRWRRRSQSLGFLPQREGNLGNGELDRRTGNINLVLDFCCHSSWQVTSFKKKILKRRYLLLEQESSEETEPVVLASGQVGEGPWVKGLRSFICVIYASREKGTREEEGRGMRGMSLLSSLPTWIKFLNLYCAHKQTSQPCLSLCPRIPAHHWNHGRLCLRKALLPPRHGGVDSRIPNWNHKNTFIFLIKWSSFYFGCNMNKLFRWERNIYPNSKLVNYKWTFCLITRS